MIDGDRSVQGKGVFPSGEISFVDFRRIAEPVVEAFVSGLEGRFREHVSDALLKSLLFHGIVQGVSDLFGPNASLALLCPRFERIAYDAAQVVFEHHLENGCHLTMNGHHVAQKFAAAFQNGDLCDQRMPDLGQATI